MAGAGVGCSQELGANPRTRALEPSLPPPESALWGIRVTSWSQHGRSSSSFEHRPLVLQTPHPLQISTWLHTKDTHRAECGFAFVRSNLPLLSHFCRPRPCSRLNSPPWAALILLCPWFPFQTSPPLVHSPGAPLLPMPERLYSLLGSYQGLSVSPFLNHNEKG